MSWNKLMWRIIYLPTAETVNMPARDFIEMTETNLKQYVRVNDCYLPRTGSPFYTEYENTLPGFDNSVLPIIPKHLLEVINV
jgi:hypothetical protein